MHVVDLFAALARRVDVDVILPNLPKRPLFDCTDTDSFRACNALLSTAFFGSLTSRWTCSGITTYPATTKSYRSRIASRERSKRVRPEAEWKNCCLRQQLKVTK
jgi:hypothetical protein